MSRIVLYDDQKIILDKLREAFLQGHKHVLLYAPTGAGKTEMAMVQLEAARDKGNRAAMAVDRIVLVEQTSARLQKYGIDHGVHQADHWRNRSYEKIQVCSQQTLEKRGGLPDMKLLIVDECHTQRKLLTEFIRAHPDLYVVGLSASPFAEGLGKTYSKVVSATTTQQLVEKKRLCPLRVFICKEVDMTGKKPKGGEWTKEDAGDAAMKITGDVVEQWVAKTTEIFGGPRKTIVFCATVAHGADLAQKFAEAGFNFVPISYKDSDDFKRDAVKDFERPDTSIHGLIACDILTKGFDVADVMVGVSARPFKKSFMSHVQQMGRTMRAYPGKDFALWLDHAGNYLRFQDDWDELYAEGVSVLKDGKETSKEEKTALEKERAKCPACGALWVGKGNICSACGHVRPMFKDIEHVPGQMVELGATDSKATRDAQRKFYHELLAVQHERGFADGWAAHKFKAKHQKFPAFTWKDQYYDLREPVEVTITTRNFVQKQFIAWARAKNKSPAGA